MRSLKTIAVLFIFASGLDGSYIHAMPFVKATPSKRAKDVQGPRRMKPIPFVSTLLRFLPNKHRTKLGFVRSAIRTGRKESIDTNAGIIWVNHRKDRTIEYQLTGTAHSSDESRDIGNTELREAIELSTLGYDVMFTNQPFMKDKVRLATLTPEGILKPSHIFSNKIVFEITGSIEETFAIAKRFNTDVILVSKGFELHISNGEIVKIRADSEKNVPTIPTELPSGHAVLEISI